MQKSYDVLVLGAGISGLFVAKELQQLGYSVCVFDKSKLGQESSWAGGGIISPLYPWRYPAAVNQLAKWSQQLYPQLVEDIMPAGIDPEYIKSGLLVLDTDEKQRAIQWANEYGYELNVLNAQQVQKQFPYINHSSEALWMPEIAQIRNPRLVKALVAFLRQRVDLREETQVRLCIDDNQVTGVEGNGNTYRSPIVVLCTGAWTGELLKTLGVNLAVKPIRGQMILYQMQTKLAAILLKGHRYVIPRKDGHILVGSTLEDVGFDKSTTAQAQQELQAFAHNLVPELKTGKVLHHWSGLRPASPQGVPFIGKVPNIRGLYVNAGHFRNGVVLGPASAKLAVQIIFAQNCHLDPVLFSL